MAHITAAQFTERFASLILAGRELPKKQLDRHILFMSSTLKLEAGRPYSESELNDELRKWASRFGGNFGLDHVTLRRFLVDEGYLTRDPAGGTYEVAMNGLPYTFDQSIKELDLEELISAAQQARELKKQQYLKRSQP